MEKCQTVIVRAFGDEPCQLQACAAEGGNVVVFRESPDVAIPYPRAYLYEWDGELFNELRAAYRRHEAEQLASLWARAKFYVPSEAAH